MSNDHSGTTGDQPDETPAFDDAQLDSLLRETLGVRPEHANRSIDESAAWNRLQTQRSTTARLRRPAAAVIGLAAAVLAVIGFVRLTDEPDILVASQPEPTATPLAATPLPVEPADASDTPEVISDPGRCANEFYSANRTIGVESWQSSDCRSWGPRFGDVSPASPIFIFIDQEATYQELVDRYSDFETLDLSQRNNLLVDGQEAHQIIAIQKSEDSPADVVVVVIDLVDTVLVVFGQTDTEFPDRTIDDVIAASDELISSLELRDDNCGIPKGYEARDFDGDGIDEYFGLHEAFDRGAEHWVYSTNPAEPCSPVLAATGRSGGSAGSPAGWGCLGSDTPKSSFVDWKAIHSTELTLDGSERYFHFTFEIATTTFEDSIPTTEVTYHVSRYLPSVENCASPVRDSRDTTLATATDSRASRQTPQCENEHWALDLPGDGIWFTHAASKPLYVPGDDIGNDRRCSFFTQGSWGYMPQCDCVPALFIEFKPKDVSDSSYEDPIPYDVIADDIRVDGYPAILRRQDITDLNGLIGEHTNYVYEVDTGSGVLTIKASSAEFSDIAAAINLADDFAATIKIRNVAPRDRPCASVPVVGSFGWVVYHDFNNDGVSEAIVPMEPTELATQFPSVAHQVLRSDGDCDWVEAVTVVQDSARTWFCNSQGALITAPVAGQDVLLAEATTWEFDGVRFAETPDAVAISPGRPAGCDRPGTVD